MGVVELKKKINCFSQIFQCRNDQILGFPSIEAHSSMLRFDAYLEALKEWGMEILEKNNDSIF